MNRKKRSPIWTYFNITDNEKKIAECVQCHLPMSFQGTITNLKVHLLKKHPKSTSKLFKPLTKDTMETTTDINTCDYDNLIDEQNRIISESVPQLGTNYNDNPILECQLEELEIESQPNTSFDQSNMNRINSKKRNSLIWSYFDISDYEKKIAKCGQCGLEMSYRGTITNLKKHYERKHPLIHLKLEPKSCYPFITDKQLIITKKNKKISDDKSLIGQQNQTCELNTPEHGEIRSQINTSIHNLSDVSTNSISSQYESQTTMSLSTSKTNDENQKKEIDKHLLYLFIQDFQPFSIVENSGFRAFVSALNPTYELPSKKEIANNLIPAAYQACKTKIVDKMRSVMRVCLTTYYWTTATKDSYLAITAHFVNDNFKLESVVLDCLPVDKTNTSHELANTMKEITDSFNITEKIFIVVSDNTENIIEAINELKWKHFGCYVHTINMVVNEALETVDILLEKAKCIISFFKRNNLATEKLIEYQKDAGYNNPKNLTQDVPTGWNASFYMLQRLVLLKDAIKTTLAYIKKDSLDLNPHEWKMCIEIVEVLEPFESISRQMSGEGLVTASQILVLITGITNVCSTLIQKPYLSEIRKMILTLQRGILVKLKNVDSITAGVCTFLDPRFKLHAFTSEVSKEKIKDIVTKQVMEEYKKFPRPNEDNNEPPEKKMKKKETSELSIWNFFDSIMEKQPQSNTTSPVILEVERYAQEGTIHRNDNPLKWWCENYQFYPYLAKIVKNNFAMVITSVPFEKLFSKTALSVNDGTYLKRNMVRQLVFLRENSKHVKLLDILV